jgi:ataxin-10
VLVTQCMVTLCLESEMQRETSRERDSTLANYVDMKNFFNRKKYQESGMVESLIGALLFNAWGFIICCVAIDLLTLLDIFLPRINFGKPVHRDGMPEEPMVRQETPSTGFSYLKRDLVRLLGVLCHGVKSVQDRAREAGGLPVVMNMCVIDERNPCQLTL